ncbi:hypothetical protein PtB15_3B883 [Puccinia triticina]|nr:hypothetical protein PtB15_3B883 [Puccinia triticina]
MYLQSLHHAPGNPQLGHNQDDHSNSSSKSSEYPESPLPHDVISQFPTSAPAQLPTPAPTEVFPFECHISYALYLEQRNQKKEMTWKPAKSNNPKLSFTINPNELAFEEFKKDVASACNAALSGVDKTIAKAGKKGIPAIEWKAFIPNHRVHPKSHPINLANPADYRRWIELISARPTPRRAGVFLSQENPNKKKVKAHHESLVAKTNHRLNVKEGSSNQAGVDNNNDEDMDDDSENEGSVIQDQELYMSQIYGKYGMNKDYDRFNPAYPHPTDDSKYLPLTDGNVRKWADALLARMAGVSLLSPPSDLVFRTVTKKPVAPAPPAGSQTHDLSVISTAVTVLLEKAVEEHRPPQSADTSESNPRCLSPDILRTHTIGDYLAFIGCDSTEVEDLTNILKPNGFNSYKNFGSSHLDNDSLQKLGLSLGIVIRLLDNVANFSRHLKGI